MKSYSTLTLRGKIDRWREVLPSLLSHYGIEPVTMVLRSAREHLLFQIDTHDSRYAVRVYNPACTLCC
jgi:Ser/Thr protein kinase RdoA (MazF antagonist)